MSATRRGRRKSGADNFPTPTWTIERFLEEWADLHNVGTNWLEPCAGDGVIIEVVNRFRPGIQWTACELRESTRPKLDRSVLKIREAGGQPEILIGDFFANFKPNGRRWDVAIMNPPFRLTMEFILRCFELADVVVCLQRMNYCGTDKRNDFFRANMPDLYVVPDRVSFTGDGNADACEHAWHVWTPDSIGEGNGLIRVLGLTTKEDRKAANRRIVAARQDRETTLDDLFAEALG